MSFMYEIYKFSSGIINLIYYMCMWKIVYLGGICIKRNIINSLLIIFTLFLCMSLVGAACAAEDVSLNNDATNGIDDVLGTTSYSSDVASVNEGSLLDNSQTGDILSTTHDQDQHLMIFKDIWIIMLLK